MNESNIVCMGVYVYNFLCFFQLQSPEVTRHAVGKTTAFGILQKENKRKYTHMSVWSERKECINKNHNIHIHHGSVPFTFFL